MQLARSEQLAGGELHVQPNEVILLDASEVAPSSSDWTLSPVVIEFLEWAPTLFEDFLTKGLSWYIEEDQEVDLRHFLLYYFLMVCKDELASKAALEKKLTEEAKRCQTLKKEMERKMNAS
ncbi:hypothetical protein ACOSQ2_003287 [Xanthoceras sorbifolium]